MLILLDSVALTRHVIVAVFFMSNEDNVLFAVRGSGSHFVKLRGILVSIYPSIEFVLLPRDTAEWRSTLSGRTPRAVLITCPNNLHLDYCVFVRSLWPSAIIYCEKPFINNLHSLNRAIDIIKSGRLILGFNLRFSGLPQLINILCHDHSLGDLISLSISVSYPFSLRDEYVFPGNPYLHIHLWVFLRILRYTTLIICTIFTLLLI